MESTMHKTMSASLDKAKEELSKANYLAECGANPGIRKMNDNKSNWLRWVVYLAEIGLETEKLLADAEAQEATENQDRCDDCECAAKDKLITDLTTINEQLRLQLTEMQVNLREEELCRKTMIDKATMEWCINLVKRAHDRCWLDGGDLVCSLDWLDNQLAELLEDTTNDH
jgi:hypothetical protein